MQGFPFAVISFANVTVTHPPGPMIRFGNGGYLLPALRGCFGITKSSKKGGDVRVLRGVS